MCADRRAGLSSARAIASDLRFCEDFCCERGIANASRRVDLLQYLAGLDPSAGSGN